MNNKKNLKQLEERIGYVFQDSKMLIHAMSHSSYVNEIRKSHLDCNERLEFLGDAVLELTTSEYLYTTYPEMPEGDASKTRASIVCEPTLAVCARELHLGEHLLLGKGEDLTGGRERDSILSDAFEALIGAIYLDGGFANAKEFINKFVLKDIENKKLFYDSKTILQELVQSFHCETPHYELLAEEGPDHNKTFTVQVCAEAEVLGKGTGRTKKGAEQAAAYAAILELKKRQG